jgi:hypothetical protein
VKIPPLLYKMNETDRVKEEQYNHKMTEQLCGIKYPSRPRMERIIRRMDETINDLMAELFCADPTHPLFKKRAVSSLVKERIRRIGANEGGKKPRWVV